MSTIVLERPKIDGKPIDLEELFNLKVRIVPGLRVVKEPSLDWLEVQVGTSPLSWLVSASAVEVDGFIVWWLSQDFKEWCLVESLRKLYRGDTWLLTIIWNV